MMVDISLITESEIELKRKIKGYRYQIGKKNALFQLYLKN